MTLKGKARLTFILIMTLLFLLVVVGRYVYLMLLLPDLEKSEPVVLPKVERGPILDRNGKILAITTVLDSVSAWIPDLTEPEETAELLAGALDLDAEDLLSRLSKRSGFVWIKRKITPTESEGIKKLKVEGKLRGISLQSEFGRNYPERSFASHLIGYVGIDNTGLDGIEWSFQRELLPSVIGTGVEEAFGNQIYLTIDMNVQYQAERFARQAFIENEADYIMILVMDSRAAEILAYVSIPSFDPNTFRDSAASSRINRPIRTAFEPGSVFKIFSIASFLQLGGITPEDTFYAGGSYERPEYGIRINDLAVYGEVDASLILKYSSNVGAAYASETVTSEDFYKVLTRFGFGKPTGVPLSGETSGILRKPSLWSARTKPTIAFGQEISVSAMQVVSAATVFANEGVLLKPRLVRKIVSPEGILVKEYEREPLGEIISADTARAVLDMMETAVEPGGSAQRAYIEGVRIAGKTGTAQIADPESGLYYEDRHIASFLGIFPSNYPELIVYVVIDNPKGQHYYGSRVAAPVFRELAQVLIGLLGIQTGKSKLVEHSGKVVVSQPDEVVIGQSIPDLIGTPKRLLLPLFKRNDLEIVLIGDGYVVRQNPVPGTPFRRGMKLILELE